MHRVRTAIKTLVFVSALASPLVVHAVTAERSEDNAQDISVRSLLALRDIGGENGSIAVSPNGKAVAFQIQQPDFAQDTYRSDWFVSALSSGAKPVRIGAGGDVMLVRGPFGQVNGTRRDIRAEWSPDGQWIAYLRREGDEVQVWRSRADGTFEEQVTHNGANVLSFEWRPDGRAIYFQVGRNRQETVRRDHEEGERGYLLDDRFVPDYSTRPLWFPCGPGPGSAPLPASERCAPRTWIVEFGSPERKASAAEDRAYRVLTTPERPAGVKAGRLIREVVWNPDHTRAAWLENISSAERGLEAPVTLFANGRRCAASQCTGRLRALWWHGDDVAFLRREGWAYSVPALYVWSPAEGTLRRLYAMDSTLDSCEMGADRLVCLQETPTTPRKIISIRLRDGRIETVFDPNPQMARYRLGRVEKLEDADGYGNQGFAHLVYPPGFEPGCRYPLVVVQYRSKGFLRGGTGDEFPIFPLAAAGFLVLSTDNPDDVRVEARYDPRHWQGLVALDGKEIGANGNRMRSGLRALDGLLDRLERRGVIDKWRIGITGLSAGAEVLYFALTHSTRFAAAATSGLMSPDSYRLEVSATARRLLEAEWGGSSLAEAIRNANRIESLAHNVRAVMAPLLIQVSDHELISVLPDYVSLLEAAKPVEAYVFPDEGHVKSHPLHKLAVGERTVDWFRFWLEDEEDPAPEKAEQYTRWRALRRQTPRRLASAGMSCAYRSASPSSGPDLGGDAGEKRR